MKKLSQDLKLLSSKGKAFTKPESENNLIEDKNVLQSVRSILSGTSLHKNEENHEIETVETSLQEINPTLEKETLSKKRKREDETSSLVDTEHQEDKSLTHPLEIHANELKENPEKEETHKGSSKRGKSTEKRSRKRTGKHLFYVRPTQKSDTISIEVNLPIRVEEVKRKVLKHLKTRSSNFTLDDWDYGLQRLENKKWVSLEAREEITVSNINEDYCLKKK